MLFALSTPTDCWAEDRLSCAELCKVVLWSMIYVIRRMNLSTPVLHLFHTFYNGGSGSECISALRCFHLSQIVHAPQFGGWRQGLLCCVCRTVDWLHDDSNTSLSLVQARWKLPTWMLSKNGPAQEPMTQLQQLGQAFLIYSMILNMSRFVSTFCKCAWRALSLYICFFVQFNHVFIFFTLYSLFFITLYL